MTRVLHWSSVTHRTDNKPVAHSGTITELVHWLSTVRKHETRKDGTGIIGTEFKAQRHDDPAKWGDEVRLWRLKSAAVRSWMLLLDFDDETESVERILAPTAGFERIHYSTYSHQAPTEDGGRRGNNLRIVLIPSRPLTVDEHQALYVLLIALHERAGIHHLDAGCKDVCRLMYAPNGGHPEGPTPWLTHEPGAEIDPDNLPPALAEIAGFGSVGEILEAERQRQQAERAAAARALRASQIRRRSLARAGVFSDEDWARACFEWRLTQLEQWIIDQGGVHAGCRFLAGQLYALQSYIPLPEVDARFRDVAISAMVAGTGDNARPHKVAVKEAERILIWARKRAQPEPLPPRPEPTGRHASRSQASQYHVGAQPKASARRGKEGKRTIIDARKGTAAGIDKGLEKTGGAVTLLNGVAGSGKTHHVGVRIADVLASGGFDEMVEAYNWASIEGLDDEEEAEQEPTMAPKPKRALVLSPTRDLSAQTMALMASHLEDTRVTQAQAVVRTKKNCERFDLVAAAERVSKGGGKRVCKQCPWHPSRFDEGEPSPCPFWAQLAAQDDADILHMSHHMFLQGQSDDHKMRLSWEVIDDAATRGVRVRPYVKRTASGITISVTSDPEGDLLKKPTYNDQRAWDSTSKTRLLEWITMVWRTLGLGDVPADMALIKAHAKGLSTAKTERTHDESIPVRIRWGEIGERAGDTSKCYAPHVQFVGATDKRQASLHITVRSEPRGALLPRIKHTDGRQRTHASQQQVIKWIAKTWGVAPDMLSLASYAAEHIDERPYELIVVDESMWSAARHATSLSIEHILELARTGDLIDAGIDPDDPTQIPAAALIKLMAQTKGQTAYGERYIDATRLAELVDPSLLVVLDETESKAGEEALRKALSIAEDKRAIEHLKTAVPWHAIKGLAECITHNWQGAYIEDGRLHVAYVQTPRFDAAERTLVLDATSTEDAARAFYGVNIDYVQVTCDTPDDVNIVWVIANTGSRSAAFGHLGPERLRQGAIWLATLSRWGSSEGCLNFTHKRLLDDTQDWAYEALQQAMASGAEVTYHNATESRGSNRWRHFHTVRMDPWYVPQSVITQDGELLARLAKYRGLDVEGVDWRFHAEHQLITAVIEQEMSRIRHREATPETPKTLVFCDDRDPTIFGYPPTEVIDPDVLVYEELGVLTHIPVGMHPVLPVLVDAALAKSGDVYLPTIDRMIDAAVSCEPTLNASSHWPKRLWKALMQHRHNSTCDAADLLSKRLKSTVRHHFGGNWQTLADALGCEVTWVRWGQGRDVPVLCRSVDDLDTDRLEDWLDVIGAKRYRLKGGEWRTMPKVFSALERALVQVGDALRHGFNATQWSQALANAAGVSERTIRAWVAQVPTGKARGVKALSRLYHRVHARLRARWLENWLAKRQGDAEHHTMVAALAAWEETGWVLLGPGDIDTYAAVIEARGGPPPPQIPAAA